MTNTHSTKTNLIEPGWNTLAEKTSDLEMALATFLNAIPRPRSDDDYATYWNSLGAALDSISDARTIAALGGNTKENANGK